MRAIVFVLILTGLAGDAFAGSPVGMDRTDLWTFSEDRPGHRAIVKITARDGGSGTGVIVAIAGESPERYAHILTAYHIVESVLQGRLISNTSEATRIVFYDGEVSNGAYTVGFDRQHDMAVILTAIPDDATKLAADETPYMPAIVAEESPKPGDLVEYCGLGGPSDGVRHFWGTVRSDSTTAELNGDTSLLSGDSGGPVFDKDGFLLGVNSGGYHTTSVGITSPGNDWVAHYPARSSNQGSTQILLTQICENGNCYPKGTPAPIFRYRLGWVPRNYYMPQGPGQANPQGIPYAQPQGGPPSPPAAPQRTEPLGPSQPSPQVTPPPVAPPVETPPESPRSIVVPSPPMIEPPNSPPSQRDPPETPAIKPKDSMIGDASSWLWPIAQVALAAAGVSLGAATPITLGYQAIKWWARRRHRSGQGSPHDPPSSSPPPSTETHIPNHQAAATSAVGGSGASVSYGNATTPVEVPSQMACNFPPGGFPASVQPAATRTTNQRGVPLDRDQQQGMEFLQSASAEGRNPVFDALSGINAEYWAKEQIESNGEYKTAALALKNFLMDSINAQAPLSVPAH